MKAVWNLSLTSFREMIRERVVLVIAGAALLLVVLGVFLGEFTIDEGERLLGDFGLLATELAAVAVAIFSGSYVLARELERQTCLLILSKPVSRAQFLLGKWGGTAALLILLVAVMSTTLALLLGKFAGPIFLVGLSTVVKGWILLSLCLCASTVVRPTLAMFLGIVVHLLGHWLGDLSFFIHKTEMGWSEDAVRVLRWFVPNFDLFNWKDYYHLVHVPPVNDVAGMLLHSLAWIFILLSLAGFLFRRKDLV